EGPVYRFTAKSTQKEAMTWLQANVFATPTWIIQKDYAALTGQEPLSVVGRLHDRALNILVSPSTLSKLISAEAREGAKAYAPSEMLSDVRRSVFSELAGRKTIDVYRRQLQKSFVEKLIALANPSKQEQASLSKSGDINFTNSDIMSVVKGQLRAIAADARRTANSYGDAASKNHLLDLQDRIRQALDPK